MNTDRGQFARPVFMDSGLAASRCPGMTAEIIYRPLNAGLRFCMKAVRPST
jgi:hypothetical protein